ncbi:hypothetical protein NAT51_15080 [Flavobacterium amniphilum]|uniref:hypothetical protein n=1 Tax=Flavobacterium amniphilum TaxID=1834035 RepID=UPI00202A6964|nr:hypothetical protein [Flavobacterium amniphilum]MCL9806857.1 hypothetical protein [Flavobacterium amniphilum]
MKKLLILFFSFLFMSCANDSESDLTGPVPIKISYNSDVKPIIQSNCLFCHTNPPQNGAPMSLVTLLDVRNAIENRGLLDRISRPQGAPGMMPNGGTRLPQTSIDIIIKWRDDGFLD